MNFWKKKIVSVINKNSEITYMSCSEGEKKRIDISIMFSFIDMIKSISSWNCNLLFIDELLDSAVDADNLDLVLDSIRGLTLKDKDLGVYIISHRIDESKNWNRVLEIEKNGLFSQINEK